MSARYVHAEASEAETEESLMMSENANPSRRPTDQLSSQTTPGVLISMPGGGPARLPPLDGSSGDAGGDAGRQPLPPIHTSGPETRSDITLRDTIISVPSDNYSRNQGDARKPGGSRSSESSRIRPGLSAIETIVYTMDKTGIHFNIEDGQMTEAGELFEYVMEEMKYPSEARQIFSLWLVSDLLELQLKPNHVPFKLACYWDELLEKYTDAPQEDIERDEPILMFQRNVFYPRSEEKKITNPEVLRLLYHEAKENVVDARYPLTEELYDKLAGLQAHIQQKGYNSSVHTASFYKDKLDDYYPQHIARKKYSMFTSKERPEERLESWHESASQNLQGKPLAHAYRMYLEYCWRLPYYGGAFFRGQVEHPGQAMFRSVKDDPVYVAINLDGVFIIDMDDVEFLLGLLFEDMKWEYAEPSDCSNRNCLPCLFLQFRDDDENRHPVSRLLQVFSREAVLMDALIESCIELKKSQGAGEDQVDGRTGASTSADSDGDGVIKADAKTWRKFEKLCLATVQSGKIKSNMKKPTKKK